MATNTTYSSSDSNNYSRLTFANKSYQSGIKGDVHGNDPSAKGLGVISDKITNYSLFQGGLNATHDALVQYDPLKTGFARLFMVRTPAIVDPTEMKIFKHILEYANTGVDGVPDVDLNSEELTGGNNGRSIKIPTISKVGDGDLTVKVYEMAGSPVTRTMRSWINGISDEQSGLSHSNGLSANGIEPTLANQSAEFVYVVTDSSGRWDRIEYACLFACCVPTKISMGHFNYSAGQHELTQLDLSFSCIKYDGPQVNEIAKILMKKYNVLVNSLDFYPGISVYENDLFSRHSVENADTTDQLTPLADVCGADTMYNPANGKIEEYTKVDQNFVNDMYYTGYMGDADERNQRAKHSSSTVANENSLSTNLSDIPTNSKTAQQLGG